MMYTIKVGDFGVSVYREDESGQWDATDSGGPFANVHEAADWVLAQGQPEVSIVCHVSPALGRGAFPDHPAQWFATSRAGIREEFRSRWPFVPEEAR